MGFPAVTRGRSTEEAISVQRPEWQGLAAVLIPLAAVLLGGGTERWSQGIVLLALGAFLVAAPPRYSAGRTLNFVLAGLLVLTAAAFLPAKWFPLPAWRTALVNDFEIDLPGTLSPQPILCAESAVLFLAGAAWFYQMLTFKWRAADRLQAGRVFAGGAVALAALFLGFYRMQFAPAFWHNARLFGPFPNRNQTADFLAISSIVILACSQLRWQAGQRAEAVGWALGWCLVLLALFPSFSRAGIIMLFTEVAVYLIVEILRSSQRYTRSRARKARLEERSSRFTSLNPHMRWAALGLSVLMLVSSLFFLFGGSTLERLWPTSVQDTASAVTNEFRLRIQGDALHMIAATPWTGSGLGSFSEIFALFRRQSAIPVRAIHPESDYLWAAAELGWLALLLIVVAGYRLAVRVGRSVRISGNGGDRRLRLAAFLAVAAFVLHGFVDVSGHRLGTVLVALLLLGIAHRDFPSDEDLESKPRRGYPEGPLKPLAAAPVKAFQIVGGVLAAAGLIFVVESTGWIVLPGQSGVDQLLASAKNQAAAKNYAAVEADLNRALAWAPLNWNLYFMRAGARIYLGRDRDEIALDFRRARFLEPFLGDVAQTEAMLWISVKEWPLAISALGEACRREPGNAEAYITQAISAANGDRTFLDGLAQYTRRDPALMVAFMTHCATPQAPGYVATALAADPNLDKLNDAQKTRFLRAWAEHGDSAALLAAMPNHADWQTPGWRWWATAAANNGQLEQACTLSGARAPKPALPPSIPTETPVDELRRQAALQPTDPSLALQAYRAMSAAADWRNALTALRRMTSRKDCPGYFFFLEADAAGRVGDWKRSWDAWDRYFNAAGIQS